MLTQSFLHQLRQGDYLQVWPWFKSIEQKYFSQFPTVSGDDLLAVIIFELINSEFSAADLYHIVTINALLLYPDIGIQSHHQSAWTMLIGAGLQWEVYNDNALLSFYMANQAMVAKEIIAFMARAPENWSDQCNCDALEQKLDKWNEQAGTLQGHIKAQIDLLEEKRNYCQDYLKRFIECESQLTEQQLVRQAVLQHLQQLMANEVMFNANLLTQINDIVNTLRALNPEPWEYGYINGLHCQPFPEKIAQMASQIFCFFGQHLLQAIIPSAAEDLQQNTP